MYTKTLFCGHNISCRCKSNTSSPKNKTVLFEICLYDILSTIYEILIKIINKTFTRGKNCIDTFTIIYNILPFISHINLLNFSSIITNDHIGIMWQFESDAYFIVKSYIIAKPQQLYLNPN